MEKKHKIIIGVGVGLALIGIVYYVYRKRKLSETESTTTLETQDSASIIPVAQSSPVSMGDTSANLYPPTPFKSPSSGNAFRTWVNKWHGDYAKSIDLDPVGKMDNSFIRKAWQQYGQEYINAGGKI